MGFRELYHSVLASYYGQQKHRLERQLLLYRFVYRPISMPITAIFLKLGASANQVTVVGLILLICSLTAIGHGGPLATLGIAGYFLFFVLDFVDGNIARFNRSASYFGKLFDGMVDSVGFLVFVAVALYNVHNASNVLSAPLEIAIGVATTIAALFRQNYIFRLKYLKNEAGIDTGREAVLEPAKGPNTGRMISLAFDNLVVSTPVLLPLAVMMDLSGTFTVLFFAVHGIVGLGGVIYSVMRNRRALAEVDRQY
jgi:phosphatidylglycerophosphate synthase